MRRIKLKTIHAFIGKIGIAFYFLFLYQAWKICQYGGVRRNLPILLLAVVGGIICAVLLLCSGRKKREKEIKGKKNALFIAEIIVVLLVTGYFGVRIVYAAIPYNGRLSWEIDEFLHKKEIDFVHTNFLEDGVEGIFTDLDKALDLPEKLYITKSFTLSFDEHGEISKLDTFLYGKDEKGTTKTYLISYDKAKNEKITVWVDGEANTNYNSDMQLNPMLQILKTADYKERVAAWASLYEAQQYEILYYGRRSFSTAEGLAIVDGEEGVLSQLQSGGEVLGFEVSLHMPEQDGTMPVRYMSNPEYISPDMISAAEEDAQIEEAKKEDAWTTDSSDGSMYFFLDGNQGWRLAVVDAAAGSRFYQLEHTTDGGTNWETASTDPFQGNGGVAEGLIFYDGNFGVAGLSGASQTHSTLYLTRDGGLTFTAVQLPMDTVTELPKTAQEYGLTLDDYSYCEMPEKEGDIFTIRVLSAAGESDAILFESKDNGETWTYIGS